LTFIANLIVLIIISFSFNITVHAESDNWPYSTNSYSYTQAEFEALAKTIDSEARGESLKGKIAVGNVIMNRVFVYNSNITSIVSAANQFAYNPARVPTAESYSAARHVLDQEEWVVPQNCYYFKTSPPPSGGSNTWSGKSTDPIKYWNKIGNHYFYIRKLDGRYNGYDVPAPMFRREYDSPRLGITPSDEVVHVQKLLAACGYEIESDGYFGDKTDKAVRDFQSKNELYVDGIVGEETLAVLNVVAEETGLLVNPGDLEEIPVEAKALISNINKRKVLKNTIDNPIIQSITVYRINEMAAVLRSEYSYSIDSIVIEQQKEQFYLVNIETSEN